MMRLLAIALSALCLFACSSKDEKKLATKPAKLVDFEATAKLKRQWSISSGSGQDSRYSRFVPAFQDGFIYLANTEGKVYAYRLEDHKKVWRVNTHLNIGGAVAADSKNVYFGTYDGELVALSAESGEQRWSTQLTSEVVAPPATNGEYVVAQTIDGRVFALESETGEIAWSYDHPTPVLSLRGTASPIIVANQVVIAFDNGQILSLGVSDGVAQWDVRVSRPQGRTELERIVDVDGTPVIFGAYIYAASYQGKVVAINRGTGRLMWSKDINTANKVSVGHNKVYASDASGKVVAFNALTGDVEWENTQLRNRNPRAPEIIGNYVAVVEGESDYLHLMNQSDGSFAYRFKPAGNSFRSPPFHLNGVLYLLADNGRLSAYTLAE